MKTVGFVISDNGKGHRVRCGALKQELLARGWTVSDEPDVWVVDNPAAWCGHSRRVVAIVDTPRIQTPVELLICGSPGAEVTEFLGLAPRVLVGPDYALLRPEFHMVRWLGGTETLDVRYIAGVSATALARAMATAKRVITYAGMRALEAACVGAPLALTPRNPGEELNARGLAEGRKVDGLGCQRVADAIEALL